MSKHKNGKTEEDELPNGRVENQARATRHRVHQKFSTIPILNLHPQPTISKLIPNGAAT